MPEVGALNAPSWPRALSLSALSALPFVVPFSKTANLAAKIIKKTLQKITKL